MCTTSHHSVHESGECSRPTKLNSDGLTVRPKRLAARTNNPALTSISVHAKAQAPYRLLRPTSDSSTSETASHDSNISAARPAWI